MGLALTNWISLIALGIVPLAMIAYRIQVEEKALMETIGQPYRDYMRRSKRLIPFLFQSVANFEVAQTSLSENKRDILVPGFLDWKLARTRRLESLRYMISQIQFSLAWVSYATIAGIGCRMIDHGAVTRSNGGGFLNKFRFGSFDRQELTLPAFLADEHSG
jgi:hypothetical protein